MIENNFAGRIEYEGVNEENNSTDYSYFKGYFNEKNSCDGEVTVSNPLSECEVNGNLKVTTIESNLTTDAMDSQTEESNSNDEQLFKKRKKHDPNLRTGKWTLEEEDFAIRLIEDFKLGIMSISEGTNLRIFLSQILNCDPMRISKKFIRDNKIGKVFTNHYFLITYLKSIRAALIYNE